MTFLASLKRLVSRERGPADLARWLDLPEADLREWLGSRPPWTRGYDYRRFSVPKRRGATRQIDAPGDKLKDLQRRVLHRLLNPLGVADSATGFVQGRSIVDNARPHAGRPVVINLDLADFFPSITAQRVEAVWRALGWNDEAARILSAICTLEGRLPQGAPTSPALSNQVCRHLDARLERLAASVGGTYTRYADDVTISLPGLRDQRRPARQAAWPHLAHCEAAAGYHYGRGLRGAAQEAHPDSARAPAPDGDGPGGQSEGEFATRHAPLDPGDAAPGAPGTAG